jgi:hypothetical protein
MTDDELLPGNEPTLNGKKLSQIYAEQMAHRLAANCFDIFEAAKAIAAQLGLDKNGEERLRVDMSQAAVDGKLTVRSPRGHDQYAPTKPPTTTYGFDSLVTPDDVNEWATVRRFLWRWQQPAPEQAPAMPAPVTAPATTTATHAPVVAVEPASDGPEPLPAVPNWKMLIQAEATALCLRLRKAGANPTKNSILNSMAQWCRDNDIRTDTQIIPSANYLRTHVLGGKHWNMPN